MRLFTYILDVLENSRNISILLLKHFVYFAKPGPYQARFEMFRIGVETEIEVGVLVLVKDLGLGRSRVEKCTDQLRSQH